MKKYSPRDHPIKSINHKGDPYPAVLKQADIGEIKGYLRDRFGIPEDALSGYRFLESGQGTWMTTLEDCDMFVPMKRLEHVGMRLLSRVDTDLEPMTFALQIIGGLATRNVVELDRELLSSLLSVGGISHEFEDLDEGYVIVRYGGQVLGCGLYKGGTLKARFPKGRTEALSVSGLY